MNYPKKTGFNLHQSRHCAFMTYSVKNFKNALYIIRKGLFCELLRRLFRSHKLFLKSLQFKSFLYKEFVQNTLKIYKVSFGSLNISSEWGEPSQRTTFLSDIKSVKGVGGQKPCPLRKCKSFLRGKYAWNFLEKNIFSYIFVR